MKKKSVLVVDDDAKMRRMMSIIFEKRNFAASFAETGDMGLKILDEMEPSIILVDINMPGISGFDFCRAVKENERIRNTPVIIISAAPTDANRELAREAGAAELLGKPFRLEDLIRRVVDLVN